MVTSSSAEVPEVDYLATSLRPAFGTLPGAVREAVGRVAGSPVVGAAPPVGSGFGGAFAGLLTLADGRRVFGKVAGPSLPHIVGALAREAVLLPRLRGLRCASRSLGSTEVDVDGTWRVLVLETIDGAQPGRPWTYAQADAAHESLLEIAALDPSVLEGVPVESAESDLGDDPRAGQTLEELASGARAWPVGLARPDHAVLDGIRDLAAGVGPAVRGEALLHLDVRPDNLLLEPGGTMRVVDWNQAVLGAPWVDLVSLWPLMHHHRIDLSRFDGSPLLAGVPDERVDALLAFFVGFMLHGIDDPPPPGCTPALRAHALFFAETTLRLMAARRGWSLEP